MREELEKLIAEAMSDFGTCPAFGYECEYVAKVEAQAAEIERLREALHKIANESSDTWARRDAGIALAGKAEQ